LLNLVKLRVAAFAALTALACIGFSPAALADSGSVRLSVAKGGWFIGGNAGNGVLVFHGRRYPLAVGGIDFGFVFGGSVTDLVGRVINIRSPYDVAGTYVAAGAGAAIGLGARAIRLRNEKGAILQLSGRQAGLMLNADLSGLAISVR
jgi:hypothetical protein